LKVLEQRINKAYKKDEIVDRCPAYSGILLFKVLLMAIWYGMSDDECEEFAKDCISAKRFLGKDIGQSVSDLSTLSRFRNELVSKRAMIVYCER